MSKTKPRTTCPVCVGVPLGESIPSYANMNHATSLASEHTCGNDICLAMFVLGDALRKTVSVIPKSEKQRSNAITYALACMRSAS